MSLATEMQRIDRQRAQVAEQRAKAERQREEALQRAAETAAGAVRGSLHVAQNVLNGGEISPQMAARVDLPRYQTGCEALENMIPLPQGGITKRPGLEHVGETLLQGENDVVRLIPFVFSVGETRVLELSATAGAGGIETKPALPPETTLQINANGAFSGGRHIITCTVLGADVAACRFAFKRPATGDAWQPVAAESVQRESVSKALVDVGPAVQSSLISMIQVTDAQGRTAFFSFGVNYPDGTGVGANWNAGNGAPYVDATMSGARIEDVAFFEVHSSLGTTRIQTIGGTVSYYTDPSGVRHATFALPGRESLEQMQEVVFFLPDGAGAYREYTYRFYGDAFGNASEGEEGETTVDPAQGAALRVWLPTETGADILLSEVKGALPYGAADLRELNFVQSADVLFLAHRRYPPAKLSRHADDDWRFEVIDWLPGIAAPAITEAVTVGSIPAGENSRTNYAYVATAIDGTTGEESLPSAAVTVENAAPLSQTYYISITVAPVVGASEYRIYKKKGGVYGYIGRITGESQGSVRASGDDVDTVQPLPSPGVFEDRNIGADTEDTPPTARNPFDGPGNYPSVVFLHQQRLGFAASDNQPLTVWLSQAGNFESMAASIPPADDDAIEVTLAAAQANRILWCLSDRNVLALGTAGGEWTLSGADGGVLSPASLSFQPQTFYGSEAHIPPLRAGQSLLFVQRGGQVLREYGYSFSADRYESGDLSLLARHILRETSVIAWAWQPEPCAVVWCVRADGSLVGLTFMREHDVVGWHRHTSPGGRLESVISLPGLRGSTLVWFVTWRNGSRRVERLAAFFEGGNPASACHADGREGLPFPARCIPCMPENSLENGSTLMRVRKLNAVKCRVINSSPFAARVGNGPLMPVPARSTGFASLADWAVPLAAGWRDSGKLELVFDGPQPVTLLAVLTTVELADMAG